MNDTECEKLFKENQKQFRKHITNSKPIINIEPKDNMCNICGKVLKNKRGVAIHKGKVHKQQKPISMELTEQEIAISKLGTTELIKNKAEKPKAKKVIKYKHKPYYCNKCNRFHKYKFRGQPSKTHKTHFKHIYKYKDQYSQSELFKLNFRQKWKSEVNNPKNDENWKRKAKKPNKELTLSEIENLDGL